MKTKSVFSIAAALLLSILNSQFSTVFAQGTLTPPGAPAPTMKSLDQIEARTAITNSGAVTISQSGSYYLTRNITVNSGDAIDINTNNVTLDLNGFTISSTAPGATGTGILLANSAGNSDITILNGHIKGGVTNNAGTYNGPGFASGIFYSGGNPSNVRVSGVSVSGCLDYGINLFYGNTTAVESCTVQTVGSDGIWASAVSHSTANSCGSYAITADNASDCYGYSIGNGDGVYATTVNNCLGSSSGGDGVAATTANNCTGYSTGTGDGLDAMTANNCYGQSAGSGIGVYAYAVATGCYGSSSGNGFGLYATTANNCFGQSSSSFGLVAFMASLSYGASTSGTALSVTHNINSF